MKSADAGATTMRSRSRESSICPIASFTRSSHRSVHTGCPESACSVTGVMKRVAASVIAMRTSAPAFTSRRVSSAALYAAMPPVMPSRIRLPVNAMP